MVEPDLIRAAQKGDRDALITLLREIETHVYRTAFYILNNEQDAMDAAQEALIRIYTKIGSYEEKAQFKTWIQRIVTNICIDKFRRSKPTVSIDEHELVFRENIPSKKKCLRLMRPRISGTQSTGCLSITGQSSS
ncbi:hypothetical protein PACILC2_08270 [Paenibacillus cisolokensis]|uniref:RNA polymerase sigma-70 region 2 domain-containing protein n=1 Tax=Paenibacillus cisolokensis TaxID=1658519 RepID=A0ABQ4N243_9BACL|nr:hypothetical protein PACILC2_08270 [Paenibacillus cisolokensis]